MSRQHWIAVMLALGALSLRVQSEPSFRAMLTPHFFGEVGLMVSSLMIALLSPAVGDPRDQIIKLDLNKIAKQEQNEQV